MKRKYFTQRHGEHRG